MRIGVEISSAEYITACSLPDVISLMRLIMQRDDIGIGGSWSEFVDYLMASLSSGTVKVIMDTASNMPIDSSELTETFLYISVCINSMCTICLCS